MAETCKRCGKEVITKPSKSGYGFKANPGDGSAHNINVGTKESQIWKCANNKAEGDALKPRQESSSTGNAPGQVPLTPTSTIQVSPENVDILRTFTKLHQDAFLHCYQLAKANTPNADERTVEIVTNGYLHDFFHYYNACTKNK